MRRVDEVPRVFALASSINREALRVLQRPFTHYPALNNAHVQTVAAVVWGRHPEYEKPPSVHVLDNPRDGGRYAVHEIHCKNPSAVLVLYPGITGTPESSYVKRLALQASDLGFQVYIHNYRGYAGEPLVNVNVTCGIDVTDLGETLEFVKSRHHDLPVVALGVSMGGNMLTKYLGTTASCPQLHAAVAVSNPFDFVKLSETLDRFPQPYSRFLCQRLVSNFVSCPQSYAVLLAGGYDMKRLGANTLRELDDRLTRRIYGFDSLTEYYLESSSHTHVRGITVPMLFLNSEDDPFFGNIPLEEHEWNSNVIFTVTSRGGHAGWKSGLNSSWMMQTCFNYLFTQLARPAPFQ